MKKQKNPPVTQAAFQKLKNKLAFLKEDRNVLLRIVEDVANALNVRNQEGWHDMYAAIWELQKKLEQPAPVPMLLHCPLCGGRHVDLGEFATKSHHTHACQHCGHCWRPAVVPTVGVQFLPGFKN